jgi:hypothetical protein
MQHLAKVSVLVAFGACTVNADITAVDTAPAALVGAVLDERADAIDFSSGAPVHTHRGAPIDLSQPCPAVYKYAYLEARTAPAFGSETNPNPLEWQVVSRAATAYRVRLGDGTVASEWAPTDAPDAVRLDRDAVPELGDYTGAMYLDVASGDGSIDTACWQNHPLAAPLDIGAAAHSDLFDWTLAAHSPISTAINQAGPGRAAGAFVQPFVQTAAEPVALHFAHSEIVGTVFGTVVTEAIATAASNDAIACDGPAGCAIGTVPAESTTSIFAPLVATFPLRIVDVATGMTICRGFDAIDCVIPPRAIGEPPQRYAAIIALSASSLEPAPGFATAEHTIVDTAGVATSFTGAITATSTTCTAAESDTCTGEQTVVEIAALDSASIAFAPLHTIVETAAGSTAALEPIGSYVPNASFTLNSSVWDAGSGGL